uniref:Uncharacterized protein n=1 Tax=viral metagenome TaxID=1070528 RepID=A0A6C0K2N1_9ZZZZ
MAKSKSQKKQQQKQQQSGGAGAADNALKVFGDSNSQHAVSNKDNTIAMNGSVPTMKGGKRVGGFTPPKVNGEPEDNYTSEVEFTPNSDGTTPVGDANKPTMLESVNKSVKGFFGVGDKQDVPNESMGGGKQSKKQLRKTIKKQLQQLKKGGASLSFSEYSPASQSGASSQTATVTATQQTNAAQQTTEGMRHHSSGSRGASASYRGGQGKQGVNAVLKGLDKVGDKLSKQQLQQLNQQLDKLQHQQGGVGLSEIVVPLVLIYASQKYSQGKTVKNKSKSMRKSMRKYQQLSK